MRGLNAKVFSKLPDIDHTSITSLHFIINSLKARSNLLVFLPFLLVNKLLVPWWLVAEALNITLKGLKIGSRSVTLDIDPITNVDKIPVVELGYYRCRVSIIWAHGGPVAVAIGVSGHMLVHVSMREI
jgi:hypothetical protein